VCGGKSARIGRFCGAARANSCAATPPPAVSLPPQISQRRTITTLVRVPVTVTDPLNRYVTGLGKNTFRLFEDDVEQEIVQFSSQDGPMSIGIVFDASASMSEKVQLSRQTLANFFKTANPEDEFFLIQFSDRPELISGFTTNTEELQNKLTFSLSGKRALLDGIYMAMYQMKKAKNLRKALIVISGGRDNNSRYTLGEIRVLLHEADLRVDSIGVFEVLTSPDHLTALAEQTGGRHFSVDDLAQLSEVVAKIGIELRNHYVLGYSPKDTTRDEKYRSVRVKLVQPRGLPPLRATWRAGYYPATP
jgi:Ca-activated chloride channel homolog